jgi:hypothetical protein
MSALEVSVLAPERFHEWRDFAERSPDGCVYAQPEYLGALTAATQATFRILAVRRAGELLGGVALYEHPAALQGRCAGPRLLLYYHGPLYAPYEGGYPSQRTSRQLEVATALLQYLDAQRYDRIILKSRGTVSDVRAFLSAGWSASPAYSYVVPLTDLREQWQRVESNLRRLIKRCADNDGVTFNEDGDFDAFFRLHAMTLGRRGLHTYLPEARFREFFARLHQLGLARLQHARLPDGRAIASQLVLLGKHPVCHTACAGMDPAYSRLGATAFLRWRGFEALAAEGYAGNDLTDAALNSVTHFKAQLGGTLETALVLHSPPSWRHRGASALEQAVRLPRAAAGRLRRALRRGNLA